MCSSKLLVSLPLMFIIISGQGATPYCIVSNLLSSLMVLDMISFNKRSRSCSV